MARKRKVITIGYPRQLLNAARIEFPGGAVSVSADLADAAGRRVVYVSIEANGRRYSGELPWFIANNAAVSPDRTGVGIRIVEGEPTK